MAVLENTNIEILLTSDPKRVVHLLQEGKQLLVQTWRGAGDIMAYAVQHLSGMTIAQAKERGVSDEELFDLVSTRMHANGGSMYLGDRTIMPGSMIEQYVARKGHEPDMFIFFIPEGADKLAAAVDPELINKYLEPEAEKAPDPWASATHGAPATPQ